MKEMENDQCNKIDKGTPRWREQL